MLHIHDDIIKAQRLYRKMVGACGHHCFRKLFTDAIGHHSLDEFYPVVMHAEIATAVTLSTLARDNAHETQHGFDLSSYLEKYFGLHPRHLISLSVQRISDIIERSAAETEDMFRNLGFIVRNGVVVSHPQQFSRPADRPPAPKAAAVKIIPKECHAA